MNVHPRAAELIALLDLRPHPEGGFYKEVFRSATQVTPADGRGSRAALTTIYFLLAKGDVSRWHRVASDEVWHLYEGGAGFDFADFQLLADDAERARVVSATWPDVSELI